MSDSEVLHRLRKRMAASEKTQTLRDISDAASDLAVVAPVSLLVEIADFQDRICDKIERLGGTAVPRRPRSVVHNLAGGSQIRMIVGPWVTDELGVLGRSIWNAEDGVSSP